MRVAIAGAPGTRSAELFAAIAGTAAPERRAPRIASVKVPDPRVDQLTEIWQPKKKIYVEAQFVDLSPEAQSAGADPVKTLENCDAVALVVAAAPDVGTTLRSVNDYSADLQLRDQMVIEGRLERMAKANQRGLEYDLLERLRGHLEGDAPLRTFAFDDSDRRNLSGFRFLSQLPLLVVVDVDEADAAKPLDAALQQAVETQGGNTLALSVALEAEIAQLEPEEQKPFLAELGLESAASARFIRAGYGLLDLISFLTMGEDECRAWSVRRNSRAPVAGGKVHSDIERGFIRAEVIRFEDFMELRSEAACRKAGKLRVEGKDYIVQDGDILHFRFNV